MSSIVRDMVFLKGKNSNASLNCCNEPENSSQCAGQHF
jgi:hypothetical protein